MEKRKILHKDTFVENGETKDLTILFSSGEYVKPYSPIVIARLSKNLEYITGDSTKAVICFDETEQCTQNCYDSNTGTFKVPFTGNYLISFGVTYSNIVCSFSDQCLSLEVNGKTKLKIDSNIFALRTLKNECHVHMSRVVRLHENDECKLVSQIKGGRKSATILGDKDVDLSFLTASLI